MNILMQHVLKKNKQENAYQYVKLPFWLTAYSLNAQ